MGVFEYRIILLRYPEPSGRRTGEQSINELYFARPAYPPAGVEGGMFLVVRSIKILVQPLCGCWFLLG